QQELRLSATQRRKITDLTTQRGKLLDEAVGQPNQARYDKLLTLVDEEEKELDRILTVDQAKRLSELVVQQRGVDAFRDVKVAQALQLTPEQDGRIASILAETRHPRAQLGATTERRPMEQVLGVLTLQQKSKWDELVGKPSPVSTPVVEYETAVVRPTLGA